MVQTNAIYRKSAKGAQAIAARDHSLTPKLRSLLILVDGKRGVEELARFGAALGDAQQLLGQLLEQGFIEAAGPAPVGASAAGSHATPPATPLAGSPAAPSAEASAPSHPAVPLRDAQRFAVRRLTDLLGPSADDLCMKIEGTRNGADFMAAIARAEKVLRDFGGARTAEDFIREMESHRPA